MSSRGSTFPPSSSAVEQARCRGNRKNGFIVQIKGSQFEVFEEPEGGQHFMFIENPEKFNRLVMEYLG